MAKIEASVGLNGDNRPDDVLTVQRLLGRHNLAPLQPVPENGKADRPTIDAIRHFQIKYVGMQSPDGRVDPDGRTLRKLNTGGTGQPLHQVGANAETRKMDREARVKFVDPRVKETGVTPKLSTLSIRISLMSAPESSPVSYRIPTCSGRSTTTGNTCCRWSLTRCNSRLPTPSRNAWRRYDPPSLLAGPIRRADIPAVPSGNRRIAPAWTRSPAGIASSASKNANFASSLMRESCLRKVRKAPRRLIWRRLPSRTRVRANTVLAMHSMLREIDQL